jgi:hypothetical protein
MSDIRDNSAGKYQDARKKKTSVWASRPEKKKLDKFDFDKMKSEATSPDLSLRKAAFIEYYERFEEFPSYLFDNDSKIDEQFLSTIQELEKDEKSTPAILKGIAALRLRLAF